MQFSFGFLSAVVGLLAALPMDTHAGVWCLEADTVLFQNKLNLFISFTLLDHVCCVVVVKRESFIPKLNLLFPGVSENRVFDSVLKKVNNY